MYKNINNNKGSSLIELIMVMMLMIVFGLTMFTLIGAGSNTQEKIIDNKNAQSDARIAMSYINVTLRKHDTEKGIFIEKIKKSGKNAILLREYSTDGTYDTWIYFSDGKILECTVLSGEQPDDSYAFEIVEIEDFTVSYDEESSIVTSIFNYTYDGKPEEIVSNYKMRHNIAKP